MLRKIKTKEFTYNYVDRIRLAESSLQDHHYPVRGSGWRHKSVSHLDLATSCHSAASGLNHWPAQRNLRPSRSLDYNHINRCKDALDIAEYYWRIDPEEHYEEQQQQQQQQQLGGVGQKSGLHPRCQYKEALYRDYADETYHSTNSIYSPTQQQQHLPQSTLQQQAQQQQQIQPFDVGNDTCSLRRSRSLAVIREETFSDLQITSTNSGRRRSQLIPRARLVNRGFFREHEARFNCANNKQHHHHHQQQQSSREKSSNCNGSEQDVHSNGSGAATCDSHQHHHHHHHPQQQQLNQHQANHHQSREADDYYDNLKRLDAAAAIEEHLHPWHNDKSDLESLNSDYFKNSLHQSNELKQQQQQQQQHQQQLQQQQLEKEAAELSTLQRSDKPRIYQSRRNQRTLIEKHSSSAQPHSRQQTKLSPVNGVDSCPENSQSSLFPETTTSNSDDQTDSLSLSEQEYDLTKIEELFQQTQLEQDDEESYELISLTTTTRTHIETTEEEEEDEEDANGKRQNSTRSESNEHTTTDTEIEGTLKRTRALSENLEKLIAYDSVYLSSEEGSESTLIEETNETYRKSLAASASQEQETRTTTTLLHISIEDTVFDSPLHSCGEHQLEDDIADEEPEAENEVLHVVHSEKTKIAIYEQADKLASTADPPLYTQILKVEHSVGPSPLTTTTNNSTSQASSAASKPRILAVVEKRKLKRAADCLNNLHEVGTQRGSSEQLTPQSVQHSENTQSSHLIRANLIDNQYHSLPDVNIGKSLKVSERIDAKLRSSYNLNKYQATEEVVADCRLRELKSNKDDCGGVTKKEIYDSIKKFGQAHQKARLREYQDLHEATLDREKSELREKKQRFDAPKESKSVKYAQEVQFIEQQDEQVLDKQLYSETPTEEEAEKEEEEHSESVSETVINEQEISAAETPTLDDLEENTLTDSNDFQEQPKEAPSIEVPHFTREIERRAKEIQQIAAESRAKKKRQRHEQEEEEEIERQTFTTATFRINKSTNNFPAVHTNTPTSDGNRTTTTNPFKIIVTDSQNNIIEEDSIEGQRAASYSELTPAKQLESRDSDTTTIEATAKLEQIKLTTTTTTTTTTNQVSVAKNREKSTIVSHNRITSTSLKRVPSKPKRQQIICQQQQQLSNDNNSPEITGPKSKDRRVLSTQIYKARPVKVLATNESFRRAAIANKMSRPQILHIVDNKRNADMAAVATTEAAGTVITNSLAQIEGNQLENEYMKKVDAVRCYWSKLANNEHELQHQQPQQQPQQQPEANQINFHLGAQQELRAKNSNDSSSSIRTYPNEEFCSFMPSIEIVELDGEKKATIVSTVSPNDADDTLSNAAREPQFDHIRYKVMKSQQLLRSNILARNKKEAQFDGLIQYLQDYSFQELLSNNNVVIVEPVRTKIERPPKPNAVQVGQQSKLGQHASPASTTEATNHGNDKYSAAETMTNGHGGSASKQNSAIKRHFFYQPVRVNRELYEEELPNPDTVRNVRKFFEEHILPTPGRGITVRQHSTDVPPSNVSQQGAIAECPQLSPRARRARKYRYLTIDTSYGHAGVAQAQQQGARKWDSASLSSGISSGDLSSPCDCNDADVNATAQASTAAAEANEVQANRAQELKGVHVQDFIRQHNTKNGLDTDGGYKHSNAKCSRPRPRSAVVYATLGENSYYRDVYEHNARQANGVGKGGRRRHHAVGADNDVYEDDDDDDGDNDDEDDNENDDDDELSESYYVSNDVLEKIRECGSSVTYYGGRVLQNTTPDPHNHSSSGNGNYNNASVGNVYNPQHSTMTLTRVRVREFETCSVCQPNECPHSQQLKDKFLQELPTSEQRDKDTTTLLRNANNDAYLGVKFKLIKSNSCSSRLELAGAEEQLKSKEVVLREEAETEDGMNTQEDDCEVVRDIVKRLEASNNNTTTNVERKLDGTFVKTPKKLILKTEKSASQRADTELTINNQMATKQRERGEDTNESNEDLQVTVNNHINVRIPAVNIMQSNTTTSTNTTTTTTTTPTPKSKQEKEYGAYAGGVQKETEIQLEKTFQSSAMNIRLDAATGGRDKYHSNNTTNTGNNNNTGTTKICRNKNVDLAFTMTKQQQHHTNPPVPTTTGTIKSNRKNNSYQPTLQSTLEYKQFEQVIKNTSANSVEKDSVVGDVAVSPLGVAVTKPPTTNNNLSLNSNNNKNTTSSFDDTLRSITTTPKKSMKISEQTSVDVIQRCDKPKSIIVPVEIHQHNNTINSNNKNTIINNKTNRAETVTSKTGDDKSSVLSCCSSTASLDKTFVRHYVANDKRLLERRKYDDIEFEEFEVYDPSKDVERLNANSEDGNHAQQQQLGVKDLSSLNDELKYKLESEGVNDRQDVKL